MSTVINEDPTALEPINNNGNMLITINPIIETSNARRANDITEFRIKYKRLIILPLYLYIDTNTIVSNGFRSTNR